MGNMNIKVVGVIVLIILSIGFLTWEDFRKKEARCLEMIEYDGKDYYIRVNERYPNLHFYKTKSEAMEYCMKVMEN
jgi:hypothetical protein